MRLPTAFLLVSSFLWVPACYGPDENQQPQTFGEVFSTEATITLSEEREDEIAQIGHVIEANNGDLIISDRMLPRLRRYRRDGKLVAATGRFGSGPGEFERIRGVAEDPEGHVYVVDQGLRRITVQSPSLELDTIFTPALLLGGAISRLAEGFVVTGYEGRRGRVFHSMESSGRTGWGVFRPPDEILDFPYRISVADYHAATAPDRLFVVSSLQYPIAVYGLEGDSVGSIGVAPPSFRTPPVINSGYLSGPAAGERLSTWLDEFTTIGSLDVVGDRFLIVTHAQMRTGIAERFVQEHYAVDVYDYLEDRKVFEDVPLPAGSRVLAGGRHLYLLVSEPPAPWTVLRLNVNHPGATSR